MLASVIVIPFILSACGQNEKEQNGNVIQDNARQQNYPVMDEKGMATEPSAVDKIEFSDPGNDEIGNDIKEMDALLNQTTPSEYNEEDLSDGAIEEEVEMK